ncbi:MAG TPA: EF-P lysine aminoacylase EpmA [Candidatus Woesebacteria bacterium]|nr:EF-P lysine aminoacylase EpmA [Candidatus Woesebacteria bacterium]HPR13708.1 EF-P lysine aminoacylase EpmA [Candidatus Woesebacteria bacterium]
MQKNWQRMHQDQFFSDQLLLREQVIKAIRKFFDQENFHEVETSLLVRSPGTEPYLEVFATRLVDEQDKAQEAYLLTSPEYAMKKLLVAGLENIYQICKSFRNHESFGDTHNPEFTILEWYRSQADYQKIMDDFARLMLFISQELQSYYQQQKGDFAQAILARLQGDSVEYLGKKYYLTIPYPKMTVAEAFAKYLGINDQQLLDRDQLYHLAQDKGYPLTAKDSWDDLFYQLFLNEIEPNLAKLAQPVIIYDYPLSQAALAKKKKNDPRFAERFEVYLAGLELGNAFSELTDYREQEERLKAELVLRKKLKKTSYQLDQDFIEALKLGMPESGGIAVGVDRLIMFFAGVNDINQVLFFPAQEIFQQVS